MHFIKREFYNGVQLPLTGSQREMLEAHVLDPNNTLGNMARIFQLNQKYVIDSQKIISIPMKAGDVLAFNSFLLHKSGLNKSKRARWTVQTRYADFLSKDYVARGWQHGTHRGKVTFCDLHAEKIVPIKDNA